MLYLHALAWRKESRGNLYCTDEWIASSYGNASCGGARDCLIKKWDNKL